MSCDCLEGQLQETNRERPLKQLTVDRTVCKQTLFPLSNHVRLIVELTGKPNKQQQKLIPQN